MNDILLIVLTFALMIMNIVFVTMGAMYHTKSRFWEGVWDVYSLNIFKVFFVKRIK